MARGKEKLVYVIGAETEGAKEAFRNLDEAAKGLAKTTGKGEDALDEYAESAEETARRSRAAFRQLKVRRDESLEGEIQAIEERKERALQAENLTQNERVKIEAGANRRIEKLRNQLNVRLKTEGEKRVEDQEAAIKEIGVLRERDIREQIRDQERLRDRALQNTELTANDRLRIERETARKIKRMNRDLADATASSFQRRMRSASTSLRGAGEGITNAGQSVSARVSAPVGIGLGLAIREAAQLEANLNAVRAVSADLTDDEFEALRKKARELGSSTKFTAAEVAGAIETLTKNGVAAQDILNGAIDGTILTAAASGADIRQIADLMTDIQLQFGLTAEELKSVGDVIQGTAQTSKFAAEDIALAFSQGGLVASKAGLSMQEYAAAIAATAEGFSSGSDAGTAFKTFVNGLTKDTADAKQLMAEYNLEFTDAEGNFKSLAEISGNLNENLAGLPNAKRNQILTKIFGTDALRTAQILTEKGAEGINEALGKIGEGDAAKAAEIRMEGLIGELAKMRSAMAELGIALAESGLIQALTDLIVKITELVSAMSESNPGLLKFAAWAGVALAVLGPLLMAIGQIALGLAILAKAAALFGGLGKSLKILAGPLKLVWRLVRFLFGGFKSVISILVRVGIAIATLVAGILGIPVWVAAAIVAAIAAIGALIYVFWDEIVSGMTSAWEASKDAAVSIFTGLFNWIVEKFRKIWEMIPSREDISSAWNNSTIGNLVSSVPGFSDGVINLAGPGTGTSDSVPAYLSKGESVITARATRFWGTDFLNGIQNMDLSRVMMPVPAPVPVVASGGQGGDTIQMNFGKGSQYELYGPSGVVREMQRDQNVKRLLSPAKPTRNKR